MMAQAHAQEASSEASEAGSVSAGGEIVVTANRRAADVSTIPYNISAVGSEQLAKTGVTDVASLSRQVPNLNVGSSGNRNLAAQVPIIRGLNATGTTRNFALGQSPVSVYLGNVEGGNYFPVDDVQRVEVLRGPQGTLFGGGSLGGTLRFIPNDPKIGAFEGSVTGSAGLVSHSSDQDYSIGGVLNVPLGDTVALRVSAKHQYEAGFIDKILDVKQQDGPLSAAALADPDDYVNSQSDYYTNKDYNWSRTTSARAALRWEPTSDFEATLAFNYAKFTGRGAPVDNAGYPGGTYIIDPTVEIPALGEYQDFRPGAEPWKRESYMGSLDMSYDMGFATLSSTTSYLDTSSHSVTSGVLGIATLGDAFLAYYAGSPIFPRFLSQQVFDDSKKNFVQELRLVSPDGGMIEYTVGAYYQHQKTMDQWDVYSPGNNDYTYATQDPTDPYFGLFPILGDENDRTQNKVGHSTFEQFAGYGEVTVSPTAELHLTGGARVFHQKFRRKLYNNLIGFGLLDESDISTSTTKAIFKGNVSYDFAYEQMVYATFSQGFRRGGVNTFPLDGPFPEPEALLKYKPDTVDNYELGVKGRLGGWRYNVDVFNVNWKNVQIDTSTPALQWPVVINGGKARSRGVELELSGPITDYLNVSMGYAFADAKLTSDFCLPSNSGDPTQVIFLDCGITGSKGDRLPGAPKHSGSVTFIYDQPVGAEDSVGATLNVNYKGEVLSSLPNESVPGKMLSDYFLVNATVSYTHGPVSLTLYARNIFDKRAVLGYEQRQTTSGDTINTFNNVTTPRQIGATVKYSF